MLNGRKLLLADDSAAIRKVIELTFSDEGMEVVTVPDGRSALEKMGQVVPDLVLADVYMPEIDGYEVCRSIKQDERFSTTPVILLISSFEPYNEAEARRAGADDVVTKPFQSIRQLVSRVGSLLSGKDEPVMTHEYPAWEVGPTDLTPPQKKPQKEPQAKVLVEAPKMNHVEPPAAPAASPADVRMQTADTMKLKPVHETGAESSTGDLALQDTLEVEPVAAAMAVGSRQSAPSEFSFRDLNEPVAPAATATAPAMSLDDAVLDLEDEYVGETAAPSDDVFLDLDFGDATPAKNGADHAVAETIVLDQTIPLEPEPEVIQAQVKQAEVKQAEDVWMVSPELPVAKPVAPPSAPAAPAVQAGSHVAAESELSPAAIDAIARRVVELMSDKVVREIAWEVVPELSEMLIKQRLNEKK